MEIKRNEATSNRPKGDRVIDASYIFSDISSFIDQLQDEKAWSSNDRNGITIFKSDNISIVISAFKSGAVISENEVEGYLTIQMIKGQGTFSTYDGDTLLSENQLVALHPHVVHSFKASNDCVVLLTTFMKEDTLY
jgi:quercetin dioxygenase-like cupin family protein